MRACVRSCAHNTSNTSRTSHKPWQSTRPPTRGRPCRAHTTRRHLTHRAPTGQAKETNEARKKQTTRTRATQGYITKKNTRTPLTHPPTHPAHTHRQAHHTTLQPAHCRQQQRNQFKTAADVWTPKPPTPNPLQKAAKLLLYVTPTTRRAGQRLTIGPLFLNMYGT